MIHLLSPQPTVVGIFTLVATKLDGTQRKLAEFSNLLTDVGLNRMGVGVFRDTCVVGTGSTAPANGDSQLQALIARTSTGAPNTPSTAAQSAPPYYTQASSGFRFAVGSAAGNLSEVGIGWSTGSSLGDYQLYARSLIKDGGGSPTTVTVLADEVLDVYYALRIYPPTSDVTYTVSISGESYNCITRAAKVTDATYWNPPSSRVLFTSLPGGAGVAVCSGDIGAITATPSGNYNYSFNAIGISNFAYGNNSLIQDATYSWGLDIGNLTGGIRSVFYQTSVGAYQTQFTRTTPRGDGTTTIDKDNTKVMTLSFRVGWARRP